MKRIAFVVLLVSALWALLVTAAPAAAQNAVVNPRTVEFTPSSDHAAIAIDGQPMVTKYELRMYLEAGGTLVATTDLGKPTPIANVISVTNPVWFAALTPNTKYVARVAAVGPTGEGVSDPSVPFGNVGVPAKPVAVTVKK